MVEDKCPHGYNLCSRVRSVLITTTGETTSTATTLHHSFAIPHPLLANRQEIEDIPDPELKRIQSREQGQR